MLRHVYHEGSAEDLPLSDCSGSTPVVIDLSFFFFSSFPSSFYLEKINVMFHFTSVPETCKCETISSLFPFIPYTFLTDILEMMSNTKTLLHVLMKL